MVLPILFFSQQIRFIACGYTFTVSVVLKLRIFYRYHSRISVISAHLPWIRYLRFIGTLIHILDKVSSVESSEVQPCDTVRKSLQTYLLKTFLP
jgi:hypothetical protein